MPRAVKTRRVQSKSTPLRNPKTLGRTAGRQRPPSIAANDKEQETEMWDHEEDEAILEWNGPRNSAPVKPAHRERSPRRPAPVSVVSHENFPEKWNRGGILMHHPGQGDCLFHALVQGLAEKEPGKKRSHRQLRAFTVAAMKNKAPADEKKWDETDSKGKDTKMSFLEYVDSIAVPGTWSGKLEAQVLAEALQMGFLVHTSWDINPEAHDTACFYFDYHCGHWGFAKDADSNHWLRKKRTFSPEEVDPAAVGFKRLRGGVARSICLSDFVSQKSSKKRPRCASPKLSDFASLHDGPAPSRPKSRRSSKDPVESIEELSGPRLHAPRRDGKVDQAAVGTWTCNMCQQSFQGTTRQLAVFRYRHRAKWHPEVPAHLIPSGAI